MSVILLAAGAIACFVLSVILAGKIGDGPEYTTDQNICATITICLAYLAALLAIGAAAAMVAAVI